MKLNKMMTALALAGVAFSSAALATDGMFSPGYGMTANGMGGAATAMSEDTFGGANNPASMVFVGNRIDLGASLFSPQRQASVYGGTPAATTESSDANYFVIPEFGYNHMLTSNLSLGVSVYGNGGMNSDYGPMTMMTRGGPYPGSNLYYGAGNLGVNLVQMVIAPTLAYKINDNNSIGISPLIGYEQFTAQGFQASGQQNAGTSSAWGDGVRVGYQGRITPNFTIGADYSTKINFGNLSNYGYNTPGGLFAVSNGELDLPANYSLGVAWKVVPDLTLALDYERILYSGVTAIGTAPSYTGPGGFGWSDIGVWKLGAEYKYNERWTLRAGWNHCDNPISSADAWANVPAPGVITDHITLGASYYTASGNEWTVAYVHAFQNSVTGNVPAAVGGGVDTIRMQEDTIGVAYAWR